jgi:hypothetical protein
VFFPAIQNCPEVHNPDSSGGEFTIRIRPEALNPASAEGFQDN